MPRNDEADHETLVEIAQSHGLPVPPARPVRGECCDRGCDPCIWDYYEGALSRWRQRHGLTSE